MRDARAGVSPDWPDELKNASVLYRTAERDRYRADGLEDRMRARLEADPDLKRSVGGAWGAIEAEIVDRFRGLFPKSKADRDKGPKVYEVHHEIAVGKECFLLRLSDTGDPEDASDYTRRRLGLSGDPVAFYAEAGLLADPDETGPEPA